MKRTDAPGHVANRYVGGNPLLGIAGTVIGPQELNNVQEELATFVEAMGLTLDPLDFSQLRQAVRLFVLMLTGGALDFTAPADLVAGDFLLVQDTLGVVQDSVLTGQPARILLRGTYPNAPKVGGQVWTAGKALYWTGTAFSTTAGGNKLAGIAAADALLADTTGTVTLSGPPTL